MKLQNFVQNKPSLETDRLLLRPLQYDDVHVLNIASYRTLEKAGFKQEGHIGNGKMVNTYCDYYLYGMTKTDYYEAEATPI